MARSATLDPYEKFRFKLSIINIDLSVTGAVQTVAGLAGNSILGGALSVVSRAGFSEITLPQVTVNEIAYRENIDGQRFTKYPGLSKYTPISLRRGVTGSQDLYNWYRLVNNDNTLLSAAGELGVTFSSPPPQSENFRKEVIIELLDREGTTIKRWILFNAFPISYKGGNDFSASSEEKLIEELVLTYEFFTEQQGNLGLASLQDALSAGLNYLSSNVLGSPPYLR